MNLNEKKILFFQGISRYLNSSLSLFKKVKFILWALVKSSWIIEIESFFQQQKLSYLLSKQPTILYMFRMHAFMTSNNHLEHDILNLAKAHFREMNNTLTKSQILDVYGPGIVILNMKLDGYSIVLKVQYDERMRFEGQMSLKLLVDGSELYYLHFLLGQDCVYIGGIQGVRGTIELNKVFTKITEGLRPQNFIYFGFTLLCQNWKRQYLYGIKKMHHVYQNESKSQEKVVFDFESFWLEQGAKETAKPEWLSLPLVYNRKLLEDVSNKKRSGYRKRYALMDLISIELHANLENDNVTTD